jgi:hypothetical protein
MTTTTFSLAPHHKKTYCHVKEAELLTFMVFRRIATEERESNRQEKNYLRLISASVANASIFNDKQTKMSDGA